MQKSREAILDAIRRLSEANKGVPPGQMAFERDTGIAQSVWRGRYWARWSEALVEAGLEPNRPPEPFDEALFFTTLAALTRELGRPPTSAEIRLQKRRDASFPALSAIERRFPTKAKLLGRLHAFATDDPRMTDVAAVCAPFGEAAEPPAASVAKTSDGYVYLLRMGAHYKVGKSANLERRIKEIRVALPEAATLVHAIATDDPDGIEVYWHRRFEARRANGEWFALSPSDVAAFRKRKFQ